MRCETTVGTEKRRRLISVNLHAINYKHGARGEITFFIQSAKSVKEIEKVLRADLWNRVGNITAIHKITKWKHRCSSCDFYPLQTCYNVCGVVTMAMAAVLSDCQQYWPRLSTSHGQHEWLLHPSEYSD